ncbi:MAG TPA: hypothetical protein VN653_06810 [Anaerolineales bacterium]|nr:hypothetical protein [Anaerolineales bacterium]
MQASAKRAGQSNRERTACTEWEPVNNPSGHPDAPGIDLIRTSSQGFSIDQDQTSLRNLAGLGVE